MALQLNEKQLATLNSNFLGTLSTIRHSDGLISSNPVGFTWNGKEVEVSTIKGRIKYHNVLADPRATFCVIDPDDHMTYVEIRGNVRVEDDIDKQYLRAQFKKHTGDELPDDLDPPDAERVVLYLTPEQVSSPQLYGGRFDNKYDIKGQED
ncbi:PPOX class F420-dependent oxidoreductase [Halieaceae bacterium IMCC14734]|uniref:PPOX class F420-dependent oxidoreductase n=1 Tax=Candidatus Litorirhabdus singularis TaxID=2518993 RepID=A0ABT3TE36_9GAMM|nr:PPOX class F420-dependent oxidoreductase [Candidatus Litorirhabdus singularis]